jgi:hypothetical protein
VTRQLPDLVNSKVVEFDHFKSGRAAEFGRMGPATLVNDDLPLGSLLSL